MIYPKPYSIYSRGTIYSESQNLLIQHFRFGGMPENHGKDPAIMEVTFRDQ